MTQHPAPSITPLSTLPRQVTPLVGRTNELAQIRQQLLDPACRLLTVLGPGGMGKTRLAIEVATSLQDEFAAGVHFINLQPLNDPAQLPIALADALHLTLSGSDSVESQLMRDLSDKEMLLLLDNFEQLLDGAEFLSKLLIHAPGIKALVTSREVLNLQEEWLFPLAGLAVPEPDFDPQTIEQYDAAALLIERIRRLRPLPNVAGEAAALQRLCQLVEGMPLALELAATWSKSLDCHEIADQIQQNLNFLSSRLRNVPQRHQSMQAVFAYTWSRLSPAEQETFMRLSVFRSSFSAAAAKQIVGASLEMLMGLVDKSLLRWERTQGTSALKHARYHVHELLRQFAEEKLTQIPEAKSRVGDAHCAYFTNFLVQRQAAVVGAQQGVVVAAIELEIDNLRAAWDWALQHKLPDAIIGMIQVLPLYYQMRSRYRQGVDAYESVIKVFDTDNATQEEKNALMQALVFLGWLRIRLGEFDAAEDALHRCQRLYTELAIPPLPGYGTDPQTPLALTASMRGNLDEALTLSEGSHQRNLQNKHRLNLQLSHYVLCGIKQKQGMYVEALNHANAALAIAEANDDRWFMATILLELGQVEEALGNDLAALHHFQRSYTLRTELADRGGTAIALNHLGKIAVRQQDFARAQEVYEQSRSICAENNDRGGLAAALEGLGIAATELGQFETARHYFYQALKVVAQIQLTSLNLSLFLHIGVFFVRTKQKERGLFLFTLVRDHTASTPILRTHATQQLTQLQTTTSSKLQAASAIWRAPDSLESMADTLLLELAAPNTLSANRPLSQPITPSSQTPSAKQSLIEPLTDREVEILGLLDQGLTNEAIADKLIVAIGTVKSHNHSIFGKLGVNNRTSAVNRARHLQLL